MHDEPMTLERLRERLDQVEGGSWEAKVEARSWILRGCAALHKELARFEEESQQWEKASLVKIMEERDEFRREAARMTDMWRKTNDKYEHVSKTLSRLQEDDG